MVAVFLLDVGRGFLLWKTHTKPRKITYIFFFRLADKKGKSHFIWNWDKENKRNKKKKQDVEVKTNPFFFPNTGKKKNTKSTTRALNYLNKKKKTRVGSFGD